jgi:hypothetical protein
VLHSGRVWPYPQTRLERLAKDECFSLLPKSVNYDVKSLKYKPLGSSSCNYYSLDLLTLYGKLDNFKNMSNF